jgi:hypothetical protein
MKGNLILAIGALLLVASVKLTAQTQHGAPPKTVEYKLGQVWTMSDGTSVTIVSIDDVRKVGRVVHVRIDNIPWQSCGDVHLTRAIEHVAVTEKVLRDSGLALSKENVDLPRSSIEAYRSWQTQKKHEIAKVPLPIVIRTQGYLPVPMICNFVPNQT